MKEEYYESVYLKLKAELEPGMKTNYGTFSHWDKNRFAIFEKGWVGYQALSGIQKMNVNDSPLENN
jgi:hypothetical protein